ncbi:hypothetical protein Cob_v006802 [Colletotrichum orbiculare MAFF 240422]|uniref:Uncharacterized protein n=1 Tax=Colletotrichum orbiculare (strain 104-T / ATCC 96160 / CBS 514.97 / LARS 414 / MAFF 240422) TaxID=1213857 RepID=A0A484FTK0_COLOR|nr:hypothetical protein Cob_v006802 [Colletotrichum orbiculare MAFF 240422]
MSVHPARPRVGVAAEPTLTDYLTYTSPARTPDVIATPQHFQSDKNGSSISSRSYSRSVDLTCIAKSATRQTASISNE